MSAGENTRTSSTSTETQNYLAKLKEQNLINGERIGGTRAFIAAHLKAGLVASILVCGGLAVAGKFEDALSAAQRGDYQTAFKLWLPLAEGGDVSAQNNIGYMYRRGEGMPQNSEKAASWWRKAAEAGNADAQNNLGNCYADGVGVKQSWEDANEWYVKSAKQGHALAQSNLGASFGAGHGVARDWAESTKWYQLAADQGEPRGQMNMGVAYVNGQGVSQDLVQAYKWYSLALAGMDGRDKEGITLTKSNLSRLSGYMTDAQIQAANKLVSEWRPVRR